LTFVNQQCIKAEQRREKADRPIWINAKVKRNALHITLTNLQITKTNMQGQRKRKQKTQKQINQGYFLSRKVAKMGRRHHIGDLRQFEIQITETIQNRSFTQRINTSFTSVDWIEFFKP